MVIVSDASPIIALAQCDKLDLLDKLFDQVCIPHAVYKELTIPNKPKASEITEWAKQKVVPVKNTAATRNGINTVGTIGILLSAKQKGLLSAVKPSLDILIRNDFRISDILYRQILERSEE
jgi:predicted nucleic acid-binding protein